MKIIKNDRIRPFDVDDTLVMHCTEDTYPNCRRVSVPDPIDHSHTIELTVNEPMVRCLMEEHHRKGFIIVWSRSGVEWATAVVRALGLDSYVHQVMSKPVVYFDDCPVDTWMKDRVYIKPDVHYKKRSKNNGI